MLQDLRFGLRLMARRPGFAAASAWTSLLGPLGATMSEAIARAGVANSVRVSIRRLDPDIALFRVRTMEQIVDAAMATPRSMAWLLSVFAIAASPYRMLGSILGEGMAQVGLGASRDAR